MPRKVKEVVLTDDLTQQITLWHFYDSELTRIKELEFALRQKIVAAISDPAKLEGSETLALPAGWKIKVQKVQNYSLTNKNKETEAFIAALCAAGRTDVAVALMQWKPELSTSNYRDILVPLLPTLNTPENKLQELLIAALTIKGGAPQLELIAPKEDKK